MTIEHSQSPLGERHPIANWEVASTDARDALAVTGVDIGKVCRVLGVGHYTLATVSPTTWEPISPDIVTPALAAHVAAADPHGDRSYAESLLATPLEKIPMYVYGDSYGQNPSQNADVGSLFCDRLYSRLRCLSLTNYAVAGTRMDEIAVRVAATWTANTRGLVVLADGVLNDSSQYGDTSGTATTAEAFRSIMAYLTARAVTGYADSTGYVWGPNWTSGVTSSAGAYVDIAFTGSSIYLLAQFSSTPGSLGIYNSSGTLLQTVDTGAYLRTFAGAVKLTGFSSGNNTIRVKRASGTVGIVGYAVPSPTPPTIVWFKVGGLGRSGAEDTRIAAYQSACQAVVSDFATLYAVGVDSSWDPVTMIGPDTIHPNDLGHYYIANRIWNARLKTLGFRQGQNRLTQSGEPTYTAPAPAYQQSGATAPAQTPSVTAATSNQVDIAWGTPDDGGATLTGFIIQSSPAGANTWTTVTTASAAVRSYRIETGLTQSSSYDFRVAAINAVGTGTYSSTATATAGAPVTVYASDDFNRADSSSLGTTPTGGLTWVQNSGTSWSIVSNRLHYTSASIIQNDCYVDTGQSNGTIKARLYTSTANKGISFRLTGAGLINGYVFYASSANVWTLAKRTASNTYTTLLTGSGTPTLGDEMKVIMSGTSIKCYVNDVLTINAVDATYSGTKHGLWANSGAASADCDNFVANSATS